MTAPGTGSRAPQAQRELSDEEILRYSRHLLLPDFGGATQLRLCEAKVLVVGAGGLGSPVLLYLAAAGVGTLGVIDDDVVDHTNLQRQILHSTADVGRPKVKSAAETIAALNPNVNVVTHQTRLDERNVLDLIGPYDVIVDGVDNFTARYLLNDACVMTGKTLVEAGILRYGGLVMTIKGGASACYRCVFEQPPPAGAVPTCQEAGVLGAVAGVVGTLQATEVVKVLTGVGEPLHSRLLQFDALRSEFYEVAVARRADCPVCGENPTITALVAHELACGLRGGPGAASDAAQSS
jgi:adenylyltransferase/sulfurtransferase